MVDELEDRIEDFAGSVNHTRCFLHVLNLVVKSIIRQFDLPKNKAGAILKEAKIELVQLAGDLEIEELTTQKELDREMDDEIGEVDDDNVEGWIDEREMMTEEERVELDDIVGALRLMLTKVKEFRKIIDR